jgi:primosomal protein N' (replication factor Y)
METAIDRSLDYQVPKHLVTSLQVGQRVKVPLGRNNKPSHGYVVDIHETTDYPRIKPLTAIDDPRVLVGPKLMTLSRWIAKYYVTPLGTVLESVIPSAVKKQIGRSTVERVRLIKPRDEVQAILEKTKAPKRRAALARMLQADEGAAVDLVRLAAEAGTTPTTIRKLAKAGIIDITTEIEPPKTAEQMPDPLVDHVAPELNEDQQRAMDDLAPRVAKGGFSVNLLLGVTGSGKTEVYLRCIRQVVEQGKQAIVLVPEIALTPQTVKRFTQRFSNVAVLHSGLSQGQRHRFWQQISSGQAQVVVGARSAIFAPTANLGIIVVDEEHESSYKQDTAPRYHARDVSIKRGQLEDVPVLLGSATPSLETYARVGDTSDTTRHLIRLPNRVRGLAMPKVELIDMKYEAKMRKGVNLLSLRLETLLRNTLAAKQQAILLLNRRGYSNFVYCSSCQEPLHCKYCDTTMTYHRTAGVHAKSATFEEGKHTGQLHCHYCLAVNPLPPACPECGKKLSLFGLGTQRVEEEMQKKFPDMVYARVDSDTMRSSKDYENLLAKFAAGEVQCLLGTQMIAKGLDYPNVTLVGVISGDTALSLPDFRAGERTFQLITQVAGRAGRGDQPGRVVLQTFQPDDPTIQFAIAQDFDGFAKTELGNRRETGLPPFGRLVRIIIRDEDQAALVDRADDLAATLQTAIEKLGVNVQMKGEGAMPCPIARIAGYFRHQIVLSSPGAGDLQRVLAAIREQKALAKSDRIAVDVDPVSLL